MILGPGPADLLPAGFWFCLSFVVLALPGPSAGRGLQTPGVLPHSWVYFVPSTWCRQLPARESRVGLILVEAGARGPESVRAPAPGASWPPPSFCVGVAPAGTLRDASASSRYLSPTSHAWFVGALLRPEFRIPVPVGVPFVSSLMTSLVVLCPRRMPWQGTISTFRASSER